MSKRTLDQYLKTDISTKQLDEIENFLPPQKVDSSLVNTVLNTSSLKDSAQHDQSEILDKIRQVLDDMEDYDDQSPIPDSQLELIEEFPDIPKYLRHDACVFFLEAWTTLRNVKTWAKHPEQRPKALKYFHDLVITIRSILLSIATSNHVGEGLESQSRFMFSALRKLQNHAERAHQAIIIVENGRTQSNQTPIEAISPLREISSKLEAEVTQLLSSNSELDTTNEQSNFSLFYKNTFSKLSSDEIRMAFLRAFNVRPRQPPKFNPMQINSGYSKDDNQEPESPKNNIKQNKYVWIQESIPKYTTQIQTESSQNSQPAIHENLPSSQYAIANLLYDKQTNLQYISPSMLLVGNSTVIPVQSTSRSNKLASKPSQTTLEELDIESMNKYFTFEEDEQEYILKTGGDDDEYIEEDTEGDDTSPGGPLKKRQKISQGNVSEIKSTLSTRLKRSATPKKDKQKKSNSKTRTTRRTATSYDTKTTHYLKSIFYEVYSKRDKLTKDERRKVHRDTQLSPRNITYWFSNHKRRFGKALAVYQEAAQESNGQIKCYDDFIAWRRSKGLSEDGMDPA
ncbi:hypothetical protein K501DRAFT_313803 [Backusella circina FSU 941]|nr:hypothetical protein K501DRAFT_313803 [Backusella circina FSU 941]